MRASWRWRQGNEMVDKRKPGAPGGDPVALDPAIQAEPYPCFQKTEDHLTMAGTQQATEQTTSTIPDKVIRTEAVCELTGLSRGEIWRIRKGKVGSHAPFPQAVACGKAAKGWWLSEVVAWNRSRPRVTE